jgi:hypothetical protein
MKPQTNKDNIINDIFLTSGGTLGFPYDPNELPERSYQIINLYKHADRDPDKTKQQVIDDVIFQLCGRPLRDILKNYEESGDVQ